MSGISINLRPSTKQDLHALSLVRGKAMSDIAYLAITDYLETPARPVEAPRRDTAASAGWFLRIDPPLQKDLEARAAIEIGPPSGPVGGTGRKTYKAGVVRRAIELYLDNLSPEERERMDHVRGSLALAQY